MTSEAATADGDNVPVLTSDGRVAGRRGQQTRAQLLTSTAQLLRGTSYRDLKVVDIARDAGTSPATFYQYFGDVEQAMQALAREAVDDASVLYDTLDAGDWSNRPRRQEAALALADAFLEYWDANEPIMRVVNLAIVEGDREFRRIRNDLLSPVVDRLTDLIREHRRAASTAATDPRADAAVTVSTIVHVAEHHPRLRVYGIPVEDLRASLARAIASAFE